MRKNTVGYNFAVSELTEVPSGKTDKHPFTMVAKFVLVDDKPNKNNQAVPYDELQNIKKTAVGMPVKMNFSRGGASDHAGSVPMGVIQKIEEITLPDNTHQLVAEAALWLEEYPDEIAYLKESFDQGNAPGISFELGYKDSNTINGIQWLKNVITLAATFVKNPAYGNRTKLLALASDTQAIPPAMVNNAKKGLELLKYADASVSRSDILIAKSMVRGKVSPETWAKLGSWFSTNAEHLVNMPEPGINGEFAPIHVHHLLRGAEPTIEGNEAARKYAEDMALQLQTTSRVGASMDCNEFASKVAKDAISQGFVLNDLIDALEKIVGEDSEGGDSGESEMMASSASSNKGGKRMNDEEVQALKAEAASLTEQLEALKGQLAERDTEIAALKQSALIDSRTRKFVEAGFSLEADAEKADKKKALWSSLSDEQFDEYLSDLVAAKTAATLSASTTPAQASIAHASANSGMPKPTATDAEITNLKSAIRDLARQHSA